jgi:hypothetical protein
VPTIALLARIDFDSGKTRTHLFRDCAPALPGPTPIGVAAEPAKAEPLPGMQTVTEPTLSEQMGGDSVPFNNSPDPNLPKVASPPQQQRKPAAAQKPQVNKHGVQKIAGGRGR